MKLYGKKKNYAGIRRCLCPRATGLSLCKVNTTEFTSSEEGIVVTFYCLAFDHASYVTANVVSTLIRYI